MDVRFIKEEKMISSRYVNYYTRVLNIFGILFMAFTVVVSVLLIGVAIEPMIFAINADRAIAEVVDFDIKDNSQVYPIIEYKDKNSIKHQGIVNMLGLFNEYKAGEKVPVAYKHNNPSNFRIMILKTYFLNSLIIIALCSPFFFIGNYLRKLKVNEYGKTGSAIIDRDNML
jgi:hypothetical protein